MFEKLANFISQTASNFKKHKVKIKAYDKIKETSLQQKEEIERKWNNLLQRFGEDSDVKPLYKRINNSSRKWSTLDNINKRKNNTRVYLGNSCELLNNWNKSSINRRRNSTTKLLNLHKYNKKYKVTPSSSSSSSSGSTTTTSTNFITRPRMSVSNCTDKVIRYINNFRRNDSLIILRSAKLNYLVIYNKAGEIEEYDYSTYNVTPPPHFKTYPRHKMKGW